MKRKQRGPKGPLKAFEPVGHRYHVIDQAMKQEEAVDSEGMTYGQRATRGLKFAGQRKNGKVLCLTRKQLAELMDDAFNSGYEEKGKWANGTIKELHQRISQAHGEISVHLQERRRQRNHIELLLDKLGVRLDAV